MLARSFYYDGGMASLAVKASDSSLSRRRLARGEQLANARFDDGDIVSAPILKGQGHAELL